MRGIGDLAVAAAAAGRRLGSVAVTDVEVLVGALDIDTGPGRAALDRIGVTAQQVAHAARALRADRARGSAEGGMLFSPGADQVLHRAYGYALAHDRDRATAADVLVALLWDDPVSAAMVVLERCGATPEDVAGALAAEGVALPNLPLPRWVEVAYGPKVSFPAAASEQVMAHLTKTLGARGGWGFNIEGDTAWVHGEDALDLPHHVMDVLGAQGVVIDETWAGPVRVDVGDLGPEDGSGPTPGP